MKETIIDLFSNPKSPLMVNGRSPLEAQITYAGLVADFMSGSSAHALLEGETGTGKTLGYCGPGILAAIARNERLVISTHTIHLQNQVMRLLDEIVPIFEKIVGRKLYHARRLGRRNFLSRQVFQIWYALNASRLDDADRVVIDRISEVMEESGGVIMLQDLEQILLMEDMVLSIDPVIFSISGRTSSVTKDDPAEWAYQEMVEEARCADILVINHALVATNLLLHDRVLQLTGDESNGDQEVKPAILVIDEADQLVDVAQSIGSARMNFALLGGIARRNTSPEVEAEILEDVGLLQDEADRLREKDEMPLSVLNSTRGAIDLSRLSPEMTPRARNRIKRMARALKRISVHISDKAMMGDESALEAQHEIDLVLPLLDKIAKGKTPEDSLLIYWSPLRGQAGFATQGLSGKQLVSRLWHREAPEKILMTSATLNMEGQGVIMKGFAAQIGLSRELFDASMTACISPAYFGSMRFRFLHPNIVPLPVLKGEEEGGIPPLNPLHVRLCLQMVQEASKMGGRILVLVPSYRDGHLWKQILEDYSEMLSDVKEKILFDTPRTRGRMRTLFIERPDAILVSPGSWVGLDLPGLIKHLVIPRLPLQPADIAQDSIYEMYLRSIGRYSDADLRARRFGIMIENAIRKMKQGLGRPIRSAEDCATVWIGDPRWPASVDYAAPFSRSWSSSFRRSVPKRFLESLREAMVWVPEGSEKPALKLEGPKNSGRKSRFNPDTCL